MELWSRISYFRPREWGPNYHKVTGALVMVLDFLREWMGVPIVIHGAFATGGHTPGSYHYKGLAVDFHFETDLPFLEQIKRVECFLRNFQLYNFVGLGIYPDWRHRGFHLDLRGYKARWGRINGEYVSYQDAIEFLEKEVREKGDDKGA